MNEQPLSVFDEARARCEVARAVCDEAKIRHEIERGLRDSSEIAAMVRRDAAGGGWDLLTNTYRQSELVRTIIGITDAAKRTADLLAFGVECVRESNVAKMIASATRSFDEFTSKPHPFLDMLAAIAALPTHETPSAATADMLDVPAAIRGMIVPAGLIDRPTSVRTRSATKALPASTASPTGVQAVDRMREHAAQLEAMRLPLKITAADRVALHAWKLEHKLWDD